MVMGNSYKFVQFCCSLRYKRASWWLERKHYVTVKHDLTERKKYEKINAHGGEQKNRPNEYIYICIDDEWWVGNSNLSSNFNKELNSIHHWICINRFFFLLFTNLFLFSVLYLSFYSDAHHVEILCWIFPMHTSDAHVSLLY